MTCGVTNHAIDRYRERVKPNLGRTQARRELYALLEFAVPVERPFWDLGYASEADSYLLIAPDCVAIVQGDAVVTVITKELAEEPARRRKRAIQRKRRRAASHAKHKRLHGNGPGRPRVEDESWAA